MALQPSSRNQPFAAGVRMRSGRSAELMDFSDEEINLPASTSSEFDDPWVKARLADMVWLRILSFSLLCVKGSLFAFIASPAWSSNIIDLSSGD